MEEVKIKKGWLISLGIFMAMIVIAIFIFRSPPLKNNPDNLPTYAFVNAQAKEAYLYATTNPQDLNGVNCHCGCMQMVHNGRLHSRGLLDCFTKPNGEYDSHGASCEMCYVDALEVKKLTNEGKSKDEIKLYIDSKYA